MNSQIMSTFGQNLYEVTCSETMLTFQIFSTNLRFSHSCELLLRGVEEPICTHINTCQSGSRPFDRISFDFK